MCMKEKKCIARKIMEICSLRDTPARREKLRQCFLSLSLGSGSVDLVCDNRGERTLDSMCTSLADDMKQKLTMLVDSVHQKFINVMQKVEREYNLSSQGSPGLPSQVFEYINENKSSLRLCHIVASDGRFRSSEDQVRRAQMAFGDNPSDVFAYTYPEETTAVAWAPLLTFALVSLTALGLATRLDWGTIMKNAMAYTSKPLPSYQQLVREMQKDSELQKPKKGNGGKMVIAASVATVILAGLAFAAHKKGIKLPPPPSGQQIGNMIRTAKDAATKIGTNAKTQMQRLAGFLKDKLKIAPKPTSSSSSSPYPPITTVGENTPSTANSELATNLQKVSGGAMNTLKSVARNIRDVGIDLDYINQRGKGLRREDPFWRFNENVGFN